MFKVGRLIFVLVLKKSNRRSVTSCGHAKKQTFMMLYIREGLKKKHVFYPHFVDKGGGSSKVDKREGGGAHWGKRGGYPL